MLQKFMAGLFISLLALVTLGGCGSSNSDTTGNLSLVLTPTDTGAGVISISAVATYTHPTQSTLTNVPVTLTASIGPVGTPQIFTDNIATNSAGITSPRVYNVQQTTTPILVQVTASTGGLSDTKLVTVGALAALSANPSVIGFADTDPAGTQRVTTASGGIAPYSAFIDAAHASDLAVSVSGNSIAVTTRNAPGLTGKSATMTISDNAGNIITVPVSYF